MVKINKTIKTKITAFLLLLIVIIVTAVLISYSTISDTVHSTLSESILDIRSERFNSIEVFLSQISSDANDTVTDIADNVQDTVVEYYKNNLDILQSQLLSKDYAELSSVIEPCIKNKFFNDIKTNDNTVFVANVHGILCDRSYSDSKYATDESTTFRTWTEYINSSTNPKLALNAYENIVNKQESEFIVWESASSNAKEKYSHIDIDTLRDIYMKYGLEELKNYEILVPKYITEDGDIFGSKDIVQGIKQTTFKFIVIQRYNIYEQLIHEYKAYLAIDEAEELNINTVNIMEKLYLAGVLLVVGLVIVVIAMSTMFNHLYYCGKEDFIIEDDTKDKCSNSI